MQIQVQRLEGISIDWHWQTIIVGGQEGDNNIHTWVFQQDSDGALGQDLQLLHVVVNGAGFIQGEPVSLTIELLDQSDQLVDTIAAPGPWTYDGTSNIAAFVEAQPSAGLNAEQSQQLLEAHQATAVDQLLDRLTLTELSNGVSGAQVNVPLATVTFGILVRLATVPEGLEPQTPDGAYWTKTLATVRLFRGSDLWMRVPIHTPTKIVGLQQEELVVYVTNVALSTWLLNIRLIVDFLPGVTGQVFQMHFP